MAKNINEMRASLESLRAKSRSFIEKKKEENKELLQEVEERKEAIEEVKLLIEEVKEMKAFEETVGSQIEQLDQEFNKQSAILVALTEGEDEPVSVQEAFASLGLEKVEENPTPVSLIQPPPPGNGAGPWFPMPGEEDPQIICEWEGHWVLLIEEEEGQYPSSLGEIKKAILNEWVSPLPIQFWNGYEITLEVEGATHYRKFRKS